MALAATVRSYIVENFLFGRATEQLTDDASFLDLGIVDSTGLLEIVLFLEREFGVRVEDHELLPENLDSIANIVRFVQSRRSAS